MIEGDLSSWVLRDSAEDKAPALEMQATYIDDFAA
jgi:hypothetical protein